MACYWRVKIDDIKSIEINDVIVQEQKDLENLESRPK